MPDTENVEMSIVRIQCRTNSIYICCFYIPSGSTVKVYGDYHDAIEKVFNFIEFDPNDEICVLGDFNLTNVEWIPDTINDINDFISGQDDESESNVFLPAEVGEGAKADILYLLLSNSLHQVNNIRNYQNKLLDLVFYTDPSNITVSKSDEPMSRVDLYHYPIEIVIKTDVTENIEYNGSSNEFNFKKGDYVGLNNYFNSVDWTHTMSQCSDVDTSVDEFYTVLLHACQKFIPLKKKMVKNDPPWYDHRLKNLKNRTSKANKKYKSTKNPRKKFKRKMKFLSLSKEFHSLRTELFNKYRVNTERMLTSDPAKFWSYIKSRKKTSGYPSMMYRGNVKARSPGEICDLFADNFESVYVNDDVYFSDFSRNFDHIDKRVDIGAMSLTIDDVMTHLRNIDTSKGDGPDNISPILLKNCADGLASPLLRIFNLSLSTGIFPTRWKTSYITPIFKSGSRGNIENYRGVAILPTIGKLFEAIVTAILTVKAGHIISKSQHGFMKGRSTSTNLVEFVSHATKVMESKCQLDVIYTDFRKAFDRVKHSILLRKLHQLGFHSNLLAWITSYLSGRSQYVKLAGWSSRTFKVTSGVPQGSHFGPLLFILFMDDATKVFSSSTYLLYADDLKIFKRIVNVLDASALQRDFNRFLNWCQINELHLNVEKCNVISFTRKRTKIEFRYSIDNVPLTRVVSKRDLGVLIDEKLTFGKHVEYIIAKAYSMLGFVMRSCKDFRDIRALKSVYFAHVRSYLEYASVVWHPYQDTFVNKIESIQKKFMMYALRRTVRRDENHKLPPYISRCESVGIDSLARRRVNACVFFVFDLLRGRLDAPKIKINVIQNPEPTRTDDFLIVDQHRTQYGHYEPINNMCIHFNRFSQQYSATISRDSFRNSVKSMKIPIKLNGVIKVM